MKRPAGPALYPPGATTAPEAIAASIRDAS